MESFVHQQNLLFFRKKLAETPHGTQRQQLLRLLAEEEAKDTHPGNLRSPYVRPLAASTLHGPAPANAM